MDPAIFWAVLLGPTSWVIITFELKAQVQYKIEGPYKLQSLANREKIVQIKQLEYE